MRLKLQYKFILIFAILFLFQNCGKTSAAPTAPSFEVQGLDGEKISLDQHRDKVLILEFWSVTCRACQMSFPELNDLQKKYQDKGLSVIGITIDHPDNVNDDLLKKFKDYFKVNFTIARANNQIIQDYFAGQMRISLPTFFIINRQGKLVKKFEGFAAGEVEKIIKEYL
jgi:peroxiredoxin